jgi:hypothetical protein
MWRVQHRDAAGAIQVESTLMGFCPCTSLMSTRSRVDLENRLTRVPDVRVMRRMVAVFIGWVVIATRNYAAMKAPRRHYKPHAEASVRCTCVRPASGTKG